MMADDAVKIEVKGLKEVQKKSEQIVRDMRGGPFTQAMKKATLLVTRAAKRNAPVDTGRLRSSITPEIRRMTREVQGVVGSNVKYAPYQEFGTRRGLAGKRYLQRALEENAEKIKELLTKFVGQITGKK